MINAANLDKLYEGVINNKELTTKELNGYGFNSKDLKDLIDDGKLERVKRGLYTFKDVKSLYLEGKKLLIMKNRDKAQTIFKKCMK